MNIAIDIEPIASPSKYRGMGVYTKGLLTEMFKKDKTNNYFLFNMYEEIPINEELPICDNIKYEYFYMGKNSCLITPKYYAMPYFEEKYEGVMGGLYKKFIKNNNIDTFFLTATLDVFCNYKKEWFEGVNIALIVYDIIPLLFSEQYVRGKGGKKYCMQGVELWKNADKILAISGSVKEDLIKYLDIDENKIQVIYSGVDTTFLQKDYSDEQINATLSKLGITQEFFLFPSAEDYRKNMVQTIKAFAMFEGRGNYQLVITGQLNEEAAKRISKIIDDAGLQGRVILTNYISTDMLVMLYKKAKLLVFPSLYEGFGLPVIEAFACGLNVVTSNNSSLGEVAKDAAVIVDPYSKESIAKGISVALKGTDFSAFKSVIEERLNLFTWENSANLALSALNSLKPKQKQEHMATKQPLAYFAPLNTKNEMLKKVYTDALIKLTDYFNVDLFTEETDGLDLPETIKIYKGREFAAYSTKYKHIVYQVADEKENMYMLPILTNFAGTVILHSTNMHKTIYDYYVNTQGEYASYLACLKEEIDNYEEIGLQAYGNENFANKVIADLNMINCVVKNAKNIVVSDDSAKTKLLKEDIGLDINVLMPYKYEEEQAPAENIIAIAGEVTSISEIECIISAGQKANAKDYVIFDRENPEVKDMFKNAGLNVRFETADTKKTLQSSAFCIKLKYPKYTANPLFFYETLLNSKAVIALDDTLPQDYDGNICNILTYEDKVYHISKTMEKLLNEEEYKTRMQNGIKKLLNGANLGENLAQIILSEEKEVVTESLLKTIFERELKPRGLTTDSEIGRIADTLAYIKEKKQQPTQAYANSTKVNSADIMREIHKELKEKGIDVLKGRG